MSDNNFRDRIKHAWDAFRDNDKNMYVDHGPGSSYRPDKRRFYSTGDKSIVSSVYNRIAIDVAAISIEHARIDENENFVEVIHSKLNNAITLDPNVDQTGFSLFTDLVISMCEEGCVALVPTVTTWNPQDSQSYDIEELRVAQILEWYPKHVRLYLYDENIGIKKEIVLPKSQIAIIENPLYLVMNEPNSTLQRLTRKLYQLDAIDDQSSSGKLDLILQLPYVVKSPSRKSQAEARRQEIETQLTGSKYGIAYVDGTEKVTQLNRSIENNLLSQIEYLTSMLYSQLGITEEVFSGKADESTMLNYYSRSIEPILLAITQEMQRKFLTKTARTQNQSIFFHRDPFKLVPASELATIGETFTRNEILSSNEVRGIIGYKPSSQPGADELRNKNLNKESNPISPTPVTKTEGDETINDGKEKKDEKIQ